MILGVGFYSFTVGSISSFLSAADSRESIINAKLTTVEEFSIEAKISKKCTHKIKEAVKLNAYKNCTVWANKAVLFSELPR
mmetsp:Transcript_1258/g.131  ORF Transcript_1258/g.131 Transcript_1258/m.131 type:complete len:81 (-) Transcript_1258:36-278(-)